MNDRFRLKPDKLRWTCDPAKLGFETTAELKPLASPIGQERAVSALDFGVKIPSGGYNVFVMGPVGTGRTSMVHNMLNQVSAEEPPASDICYVYNFDDPNKPKAITLPAGRACALRDDLEELVEDVRREIGQAFESEEYVERRDELVREFRETRQAELGALETEAKEAGMVVGRGPAGIVIAPAKDGELMSPQDYGQLPDEERKVLDDRRSELQEKLNEILRRHHREEKKTRAEVKKLDQQEARFAVGHLFEELQARHVGSERVTEHLRRIEEDIIANVDAMRERDEEGPELPAFLASQRTQSRYELYRVNVLLACEPQAGAPVVYEPNPTIDNLTGKVEHQTQMGAFVTDFTMIRPGALHRANGGYLILEAEALLRRPYAWEALKRALKNRDIHIESLADQLRFMATVTLEPEAVPLSVKVILVGTPMLYYLLHSYDDDFRKLFKVKADFDSSTKRTAATVKQYARFIGTLCDKESLPHFSAGAAALVIEQAARLADDQAKLSTRFMDVADLVRQAAYWSGPNGNTVVTEEDVHKAIAEHTHRSNRIEERMLEMVDRDFIHLDLDGEAVGQVNGLSVVPLGDYWFGRPTRITARTYAGKNGVTQIDREAKLTGRIHDKGLLILTAFLGDRYGQKRALSVSATVTFEQSYQTIDGDSASSTELYALLSSLSGLPINQGIAVTGSVDQSGRIQPIGGANEKIEGFFKACESRGLTGTQGVMIPKANVQTLALSHEVVEAVEQGKFHIYAVSTVDQGIELLTGVKAGTLRKSGTFTPGSVNRRVQDALDAYADAADGKHSDNNSDDDHEDQE